ncbi:MAG TPA: restriction endonuclease [Verrucomicrobiae bacterium]
MAVPEFNDIKAPAMQFFADGKPHKISEIYLVLAKHFSLTEADLSEMLPSGTQSRWHNRANWACYDLYRAGLLDKPKRGFYVITELGKKVAEAKPKVIDRDFLLKFPKFSEWLNASEKSGESATLEKDIALKSEATPNEVIDAAFKSLQATLNAELMELVRKMNPYRFERLVLDLLLAMGYGGSREEAATVTQKSNDEGIDGLINEDRLGLDRIYVQAKRWKDSVGRPHIQNFVGALAGQHAQKGIFITTSDFSTTARDYVKNLPQRVILIDGQRLAELMIEHNIGVSRAYSYEIKRVDSDYFEEE